LTTWLTGRPGSSGVPPGDLAHRAITWPQPARNATNYTTHSAARQAWLPGSPGKPAHLVTCHLATWLTGQPVTWRPRVRHSLRCAPGSPGNLATRLIRQPGSLGHLATRLTGPAWPPPARNATNSVRHSLAYLAAVHLTNLRTPGHHLVTWQPGSPGDLVTTCQHATNHTTHSAARQAHRASLTTYAWSPPRHLARRAT